MSRVPRRFEAFAVTPAAAQRPPGGPALRAVGQALTNPDHTITVWLDALPTGGTLLLRPCPRAASLRLIQRDAAADLASARPAGQA